VAIGRHLENLPALKDRLAATNAKYLEAQAELLASTVDAGHLVALAQPTLVGQRRIPGIKLHDDRVIRLLEILLHPGGFVADWTTRDFADVQSRADYSALSTDRVKVAGAFRGRLEGQAFVARVTERGWVTDEQVARLPDAVAAWAASEDAVSAFAECQALGWKR
jgi:hypothetical protein